MSRKFTREVRINRSPADVFAWHEMPGALRRLTPPWETVEVHSSAKGVKDGAQVKLRSKVGPVWTSWVMEHFDYRAGEQFCDRQLKGPFAKWEHVHCFADDGSGGCVLSEKIEYELPGGAAGSLAVGTVEKRLDQMFAYRHAVTKADLELPIQAAGRVLISGASGMIGSALGPFLETQGWRVDRLVRRPAQGDDEIRWDPSKNTIDWPDNYSCDAVIHLAGANIAEGRWTESRRDILRRSRVDSTRTLVTGLRQLAKLPRALLSGSAIGIYGSRGDEVLTETSERGSGFLADICQAWEAEADGAGMRTVKLRTGVVLSPAGGALAKLLPIFKSALGGPLGDGQFWQSWIALDDWLYAVRHLLSDESISGPVNLVAPEAVRQREFAQQLVRCWVDPP